FIVRDIDRRARGEQHEGVHERQGHRIDDLGAFRRPDSTAEIEEPISLRVRRIERVPEKRPEPGHEEHYFRDDEQDHPKSQAEADPEVVMAVVRLDNDIAPPAQHGEQNARDTDREYPRTDGRAMHKLNESEGRDEAEGRADQRPGAWVD